ncbi:MAG: CBS domain-containing protein [Sediminibacterium sp.]|nr:CBS domain-containing protein [Sediminibacterium sp.]
MKSLKFIFDKKGPYFNTIIDTQSVLNAISLMKADNLSYLIVLNKAGKFLGLITEKDYLRNVKLVGKNSETTLVSEIINTDLPIVDLNDGIDECINILEAHKVNYLIVFNNRTFYGVITIHDLLRAVSNKNY